MNQETRDALEEVIRHTREKYPAIGFAVFALPRTGHQAEWFRGMADLLRDAADNCERQARGVSQ